MDPLKCKSPSPAYSLYQREVFLAGAKGIGESCFRYWSFRSVVEHVP